MCECHEYKDEEEMARNELARQLDEEDYEELLEERRKDREELLEERKYDRY